MLLRNNDRVRIFGDSIIVGLCLGSFACNMGSSVTQRFERRSPDGRWVASVRSEIIGGAGSELDQTIVTIAERGHPKSQKEVLILTHQYPTIPISLSWRSPDHLTITYRDSGKPGDHLYVNFRAASYADVAISVISSP